MRLAITELRAETSVILKTPEELRCTRQHPGGKHADHNAHAHDGDPPRQKRQDGHRRTSQHRHEREPQKERLGGAETPDKPRVHPVLPPVDNDGRDVRRCAHPHEEKTILEKFTEVPRGREVERHRVLLAEAERDGEPVQTHAVTARGGNYENV